MVHDVFSGVIWLKPAFWVAVAFVLFFAIFGGRLWRTLAAMLDNRAEEIRRQLAEAAELRRQAEAMLEEAKRRRNEALAQAEALLQAAKHEAESAAAAAPAEAEAAAQRRERMAMERIAAAEKAALKEVRQVAAEIAAQAAAGVISQTLTPDADAAIVDRAISRLPEALRAA